MNAVKTVADILAGAGVDVYTKMPEFGQGNKPNVLAVISAYETTAARNDGSLAARYCYITVSVMGFSETAVDNVKESVIALLESRRIRYSGCRYAEDELFPKEFRRDLEFVLVNSEQ